MSDKQLVIASPDGTKRPLKTNIFDFTQLANTQLAPLFPYCGPGSIVPCSAAFRSDGKDSGTFHHCNSVDEISIIFGSNVPNFRVGMVVAGAREHDVGGPPAEFPSAYMLLSVTQRQAESSEQTEEMAFHCENCHQELYRHAFDGGKEHYSGNSLPMLPTIKGAFDAAQGFKGGECGNCKHINKAFPHERWGWGDYLRRSEISGVAVCDYREAMEK